MNRCLATMCLLIAFTLTAVCGLASEPAKEYPTEFSWGRLVADDSAVHLHVEQAPEDGQIAFPRMFHPYRKLYLKSAPEMKLKFVPGVHDWVITLPPAARKQVVVVMETVGQPQLRTHTIAIKPDENGHYILPAHEAIVHGEKLRYEPQPHKNTVGYWTIPTDWCHWIIDAKETGTFDVHILQGCGKNNGGSKVEMSLGNSELSFEVEETGHFQNFKDRKIGQLVVEQPGKLMLRIRPIRKANVAVMDVRQVRLIPVD